MARLFLARSAARYNRGAMQLTAAAERALATYTWPGNVRELAHLMERAALMTAGSSVQVQDLGLGGETGCGAADPVGGLSAPSSSKTSQSGQGGAARAALDGLTLDAAEEMLVRQALDRSGGNIQRAADALGLSRPALYRRLEKFGIAGAGD
jgi:DNA-binding NtrC family response regulator